MIKILVIFLLLSCSLSEMYSQCCSAGNPFTGDPNNVMMKRNQIFAGVLYKHSFSDTHFNLDEPIEIISPLDEYYNYSELKLSYSVTDKLLVNADMGYFFNKTIDYGNDVSHNGFGPGDLVISSRYNLFNIKKIMLKISPGLGIKLPVGIFDQEVNNVKLPITVQPSSGSFKYFASVYLMKAFYQSKISVSASLNYEISQLIESEYFYYKYGNQFIASAALNYKMTDQFLLSGQLRVDNKARAFRENDTKVEATGYTVLLVTPQLSYKIKNKWQFNLMFDYPVYKYFNGIQMTNKYSFSAGVSMIIDALVKEE